MEDKQNLEKKVMYAIGCHQHTDIRKFAKKRLFKGEKAVRDKH
jgi:hypothetical protein